MAQFHQLAATVSRLEQQVGELAEREPQSVVVNVSPGASAYMNTGKGNQNTGAGDQNVAGRDQNVVRGNLANSAVGSGAKSASEPSSEKKGWGAAEWGAIIALPIAAVAIIVAVTVPEIRRLVHLDPPLPAVSPATAPTALPPTP
jgi:hypothetical protein